MKQAWSADELAERRALDPTDWEWLASKIGANRLGFAVLLKFFQNEGRFPQGRQDVPATTVRQVSEPCSLATIRGNEEYKRFRAASEPFNLE